MLGSLALAAALIAGPEVGVSAGVTTEGAAGVTPTFPGETPVPAASIEITPRLVLLRRTERSRVALGYEARLFYRGFLTDTSSTAPLLDLHTVRLDYTQVLSPNWRSEVSGSFAYGAVDFQAAAQEVAALGTPGAANQVAAVQAIETMSGAGSVALEGSLNRRLQWTNTALGSYTRPIGDSAVAQPEAARAEYTTTFDYVLGRSQTLIVGAGAGLDIIEIPVDAAPLDPAAPAPDPSDDTEQRLFHSYNALVGYGWTFARESSVALAGGAQIAFADSGTSDIIWSPVGSFELEWVPIRRRAVRLRNSLGATVEGSLDQLAGTFQPRVGSTVAFTLTYGARLAIDLTGSFTTPLQRADQVAAGGAGDSQIDVSLPITYRFSDDFTIGAGARGSHFYSRFPPPGGRVAPSTTVEGFLSLTYAVSTMRDGD